MSTQSTFSIFDSPSDLISTSSELMDMGEKNIQKNIQLILLYVLKCIDMFTHKETRAECRRRHSCHLFQGKSIKHIYVGLD